MVRSAPTVWLRSAAASGVAESARRAFPHEACGLLIGPPRSGATFDSSIEVSRARPVANVAPEAPERQYRISPKDYRRVEEEADRAGASIVGVFHSHPGSGTHPSRLDEERAWPDWAYLIVSIMDGRPLEFGTFGRSEVDERLRPWTLRVERPTLARIQQPNVRGPLGRRADAVG
jgi:proteasome lid subunit RPN8/RPN11